MTPKIVRYMIFSIAAGLMLAAMTACGGGGGEEPTPEPEVDLQATIAARLANALPTDTPAPEPTDTPEPTATPVPTVPPTPDVQATIDAAIAQTRAAVMPTPTPEPTPTPPPPTATPEPAPVPTNTPAPTNTPSPTSAPVQSSGPPCVIAGKVTINGNTAREGTIVLARIKDADDAFSVQAQTDEKGIYKLTISRFDAVFDLFVDGDDTDVDTPRTSRGCRELLNLTVN